MVLFLNLKVGSRVQTEWKSFVVKGTVRYAGGLITKEGDWVGVELDEPVGDCSGLYKGRRYFKCNARRGIFIQPRYLHLLGNWKTTSGNSYRTVSRESFVDETLFGQKVEEKPVIRSWKDPVMVSSKYAKSSKKTAFSDGLTLDVPTKQRVNFHKSHLVGSHLPARSRSADQKERSDASQSTCKHLNTFVPSSPSIPNIHVPRPVLRRMTESQYFGTSLPRYNTLY